MKRSLFSDPDDFAPWNEELEPGAMVLHGFALKQSPALLSALNQIVERAPFRQMTTPGGFKMSVAMTNCGTAGWITDRRGYRYETTDPLSGHPWPALPQDFQELATTAAVQAGFKEFVPDACLINRYEPGTRLTLHQDKNEQDLNAPIVSVSLGIPAVFQFGGLERTDKTRRIPLTHGDVVVWGGRTRLYYHGILPLKENKHEVLGRCRINLTFRKAFTSD